MKPRDNDRLGDRWAGLLLVACAALPFATVFPKEFTNWDDGLHVSRNVPVQHPTWTNLGLVLSEPVAGNYVPVTMFSYVLDWQVHGDQAWGFALTNTLLYAASCLLLVRCCRQSGAAPETAWLAGLLFAIHPLHVEPVAWISGRKDLLCLLWLLAMQLAYVRWIQTGSRRAYRGSLLFLALAGLSKPVAMSAGAALWLYEVLIAGRKPLPALRNVAPHLALCAAIVAVAFWTQSTGQAFRGAEDPRWADVGRAGCKILVDVVRCFVPVPYSPFYPADLIDRIPDALRWTAPALVAAISLGLVTELRRPQKMRLLAYGWFGSLAFLLPVSGVVPLGWTSFADRYLLIPTIASCLAMAWVVRGTGLRALTAAAYGLVLCSAVLVHVRAYDWSNSVTLWEAVLERFPDSPLAWKNLTTAYYQQGQPERAVEVARAAVERVPGDVSLLRNAAELLLEQRSLAEAERLLQSLRAEDPDAPEVHLLSAKLAVHQQRPEEALSQIGQALAERPAWGEAWLTLSYAADQAGDSKGAAAAAEKAAVDAPDDEAAHRRVIELQLRNGDLPAALDAAQRATAQLRHSRELWALRVGVLRRAGKPNEAAAVQAESERYVPPSSGV